jgi:putative ABC transport system permease protein
MRLPLSHIVRNACRRPWRSAMTAGGIGVVVFSAVIMLSLAAGMKERLGATGEPENILLISRKGQNIMFSSLEADETVHLFSLPGVARTPADELLISEEIMHMCWVDVSDTRSADGKRALIYVRGVETIALDVHRRINLIDGHFPEDEQQVMVGTTAFVKLGVPREEVQVGRTVDFEGETWTICGLFEAGGALVESELWVRSTDLMTALRRRTSTFAVIRFEDPSQAQEALTEFEEAGALSRYFKGWSENDYYREFTGTLNWVYWLTTVMVAAVALAGLLIGVNTMYTTVVTRARETATQRVLGFSRTDVSLSLAIESLLIAVAGGGAGVLLGFVVQDLPIRTSQGAFFLRVGLPVVAGGVALSVLIGMLGALLPLSKLMRMTVVEALRYR